MATMSKETLSGSTNGRPIKVVQTATAGTQIHQAHATHKDELNLYATNTDTVERQLTLEFGGVTAPDDLLKIKIPPGEMVLACPGLVLTNSLNVKAFADAANVINIAGYVNRIAA